MKYWRPDPALAPYVSGYHLYCTPAFSGSSEDWAQDVFFPAWANLRVLLTPDTQWEIRTGEGDWQGIEGATLFGPTSGLTWTRSSGGVAVGVGLRPAGAFHLLRNPAGATANLVTPAKGAIRPDIDALVEALQAADRDDSIPDIFDNFLSKTIKSDARMDARIGAVEQAILDPGVEGVAQLRARTGISQRALQRLCNRAFGLPARTLLRRARFLRSFDAMRASPRGLGATLIDESYFDYSHFAKDAQDFFGMSPREFIKLDTPLARQSMALRRDVLGAPVQALGTRD